MTLKRIFLSFSLISFIVLTVLFMIDKEARTVLIDHYKNHNPISTVEEDYSDKDGIMVGASDKYILNPLSNNNFPFIFTIP